MAIERSPNGEKRVIKGGELHDKYIRLPPEVRRSKFVEVMLPLLLALGAVLAALAITDNQGDQSEKGKATPIAIVTPRKDMSLNEYQDHGQATPVMSVIPFVK